MTRLAMVMILLTLMVAGAAEPEVKVELTDAPLSEALTRLSEQVPTLEYVALARPGDREDVSVIGSLPVVMTKLAASYRLQATAYGDLWILAAAPEESQGPEAWLAALPAPAGALARELAEGGAPPKLAQRTHERAVARQAATVAMLRQRWQQQSAKASGPGWQPLVLSQQDLAEVCRAAAALSIDDVVNNWGVLTSGDHLTGLRANQRGDQVILEVGYQNTHGVVWLPGGRKPQDLEVPTLDAGYRLGWAPERVDSRWHAAAVLRQPITMQANGPSPALAASLAAVAGVAVELPTVARRAEWWLVLRGRPLWQVLDALTVATGQPWGPTRDACGYRLASMTAVDAVVAALPLPWRVSALSALHEAPLALAPLAWAGLTPEQRVALLKGETIEMAALTPELRRCLSLNWPGHAPLRSLRNMLGPIAMLQHPETLTVGVIFVGSAADAQIQCRGVAALGLTLSAGTAADRQRLADCECPAAQPDWWTDSRAGTDGSRVQRDRQPPASAGEGR